MILWFVLVRSTCTTGIVKQTCLLANFTFSTVGSLATTFPSLLSLQILTYTIDSATKLILRQSNGRDPDTRNSRSNGVDLTLIDSGARAIEIFYLWLASSLEKSLTHPSLVRGWNCRWRTVYLRSTCLQLTWAPAKILWAPTHLRLCEDHLTWLTVSTGDLSICNRFLKFTTIS